MKIKILTVLCVGTTLSLAQQVIPEDPAGPGRFSPVTLASEFFDNNYFNYYGFANAVYDSFTPVVQSGQTGSRATGGFGYQVGGGLSAAHRFRRGQFGLSYYGSYQNYASSAFSSGTNQNLNFTYTHRLSRRWTLSIFQGAGILFYGNSYLGSQPTSGTYVQANPFAAETRFVSSNVGLNYQFSRRLSFSLGGGFYLQRYSFAGAIGSTGGSGTASVFYRVTPRATVSGSYSHSYYKYQRGSGDANVDSINVSISYLFPNHWTATGSVGVAHSNTSGFVTLPLSQIASQQGLGQIAADQGVGGYIQGFYNSSANLPSFYGSVIHNLRRSSFTAGGGQSVVSGNGYYLASRNQFLNGGYSRTYRRGNLSAGLNYYRLKSVANSIESTYNGINAGVGYGYTVTKHLSTNVRYDFLRFGALAPLNPVTDHRISFGISISSKSIPLTFY